MFLLAIRCFQVVFFVFHKMMYCFPKTHFLFDASGKYILFFKQMFYLKFNFYQYCVFLYLYRFVQKKFQYNIQF